MRQLKQSIWTARRTLKHKCDACCLPIIAGDNYVDLPFVDEDGDNEIWIWTEHTKCTNALEPGVFNQGSDDPLEEHHLVSGRWDDEDLTPEWREWYRQRKAMEVEA